ncbi:MULTISPECIES: hypothetical protein [Lelliottia]|uniref:hypothetical protein n=1 Tax=Lelliottia TaxID=1330545 RepID=UPI001E33E5D3|nr:hypothetical protein [Lelliottia nimipressuralis]
MIKVFHSSLMTNSEEAYKIWLQENPYGFVVNLLKSAKGTNRQSDRVMTCVHKANCHTINGDEKSAFTTNAYFKCCSTSQEEVEAKAQLITGLTSLRQCTKCFTKGCA